MEIRIKEIVDALKLGTEEGRLNWQSTEREDEYSILFGSGGVTVDNWNHIEESDGTTYKIVDIAFLNSVGEIIDQISFEKTTNSVDYKILLDLHQLAKRNTLKIDETLNNILNDIELMGRQKARP